MVPTVLPFFLDACEADSSACAALTHLCCSGEAYPKYARAFPYCIVPGPFANNPLAAYSCGRHNSFLLGHSFDANCICLVCQTAALLGHSSNAKCICWCAFKIQVWVIDKGRCLCFSSLSVVAHVCCVEQLCSSLRMGACQQCWQSCKSAQTAGAASVMSWLKPMLSDHIQLHGSQSQCNAYASQDALLTYG